MCKNRPIASTSSYTSQAISPVIKDRLNFPPDTPSQAQSGEGADDAHYFSFVPIFFFDCRENSSLLIITLQPSASKLALFFFNDIKKDLLGNSFFFFPFELSAATSPEENAYKLLRHKSTRTRSKVRLKAKLSRCFDIIIWCSGRAGKCTSIICLRSEKVLPYVMNLLIPRIMLHY